MQRNPYHVMFETSIVVFLLYVLFFKKRNIAGSTSISETLSAQEIDMLVDEWEPKPLVECTKEDEERQSKQLVVESRVGRTVQLKVCNDGFIRNINPHHFRVV